MPADLTITTRLSDGLYQLLKGPRRLNEYARIAMAAELVKHYRLRIPRHFEVSAHDRYHYANRKLSTLLKKRDFWHVSPNQDLVRSGKTKQNILSKYTLTFRGAFGGADSGGKLQGRLNMFLPYPFKRPKNSGIQPQQIADEITSLTQDEADEIMNGYLYRLTSQINAYAGPMRYLRRTPGGGASRFTKSGRSIGPRVGPSISQRLGPGF